MSNDPSDYGRRQFFRDATGLFAGAGLVVASGGAGALIERATNAAQEHTSINDQLAIEAQQNEQRIYDETHYTLQNDGSEAYTIVNEGETSLELFHFGNAPQFLPTHDDIKIAVKELVEIFATESNKVLILPPRLMLLLCTNDTREDSQVFTYEGENAETIFEGFVRNGIRKPEATNDTPQRDQIQTMRSAVKGGYIPRYSASSFIHDQIFNYRLSQGGQRNSNTRTTIIIPPSQYTYSSTEAIAQIQLQIGSDVYAFSRIRDYYLFMIMDAVIRQGNRYTSTHDLDSYESEQIDQKLWPRIVCDLCHGTIVEDPFELEPPHQIEPPTLTG